MQQEESGRGPLETFEAQGCVSRAPWMGSYVFSKDLPPLLLSVLSLDL